MEFIVESGRKHTCGLPPPINTSARNTSRPVVLFFGSIIASLGHVTWTVPCKMSHQPSIVALPGGQEAPRRDPDNKVLAPSYCHTPHYLQPASQPAVLLPPSLPPTLSLTLHSPANICRKYTTAGRARWTIHLSTVYPLFLNTACLLNLFLSPTGSSPAPKHGRLQPHHLTLQIPSSSLSPTRSKRPLNLADFSPTPWPYLLQSAS